jgi:hypothetical protein
MCMKMIKLTLETNYYTARFHSPLRNSIYCHFSGREKLMHLCIAKGFDFVKLKHPL